MQGAGRLRDLGNQQSLKIFCPDDVLKSMKTDKPTVKDVLNWVLTNTRQMILSGLMEWAGHGLYHHTTVGVPESMVIAEDWSLEKLYGNTNAQQSVSHLVETKFKFLSSRCETTPEDIKSCKKIVASGIAYGGEIQVRVSSCTEECEREMEDEQEQERVAEDQIAAQKPREESPWDYSKALLTTSASQLSPQVGIKNILALVSENLTVAGLKDVAWRQYSFIPRFFATKNFIETIDATELNLNLWHVNHVLLFSDGSVLLLSEMEANGVLAQLQDARNTKVNIRLTTLAYIEEFGDGAKCSAGNQDLQIDPYVLTAMELFNGKTTFPQDRIYHLEHMLVDSRAKSAVMELVILRGMGSSLSHSDLERCCELNV